MPSERLYSGSASAVAALASVQHGEVVQRGADRGVVGPQRLLADAEDTLVQRLGLGVAALAPVQHGEIVQRDADFGVFGAEGLLCERKRLLGNLGRLGIFAGAVKLAHALVQRRQIIRGLRANRSAGNGR